MAVIQENKLGDCDPCPINPSEGGRTGKKKGLKAVNRKQEV
jgi:hypothetical protein